MTVVVNTDLNTIAMSVGPVVVLGKHCKSLPREEWHAVVAHEQGHIRHRHALKRVWRIVTLRWSGLQEFCRSQEIEADRFAVHHGHGDGLKAFLSRFTPHKNPLHPTTTERMENIDRWMLDV